MSPWGWCTYWGCCLKAGFGGWGTRLCSGPAQTLFLLSCCSAAPLRSSLLPLAFLLRACEELGLNWKSGEQHTLVGLCPSQHRSFSALHPGPANPPCSKGSCDFLMPFAGCFLWMQRVIHPKATGSRHRGGSRCWVVQGTGHCSCVQHCSYSHFKYI